VVVLKADADLISSVWITLPESKAFDAKLTLEEERENSGKSLSFSRVFEAHHTKADADHIAKGMYCADLEGRHLEFECVRDEAAVGFSRRCFLNETNNGTNGNGLRVTVLDINVKTVNAMGLIEVVDLMSDGSDEDYYPLADDAGYDNNDSDYQVNDDIDWAAKRKKTVMKRAKVVKWHDTKTCYVMPSAAVEDVELEKQRPKRKGNVTVLRSEVDAFSAENDLEICYKGDKVTDLSQAYLVASGKGKICELPHIQRALCLVFDLHNAKLVDSYKSEQKTFRKWL